jgi:O-antigen ligase
MAKRKHNKGQGGQASSQNQAQNKQNKKNDPAMAASGKAAEREGQLSGGSQRRAEKRDAKNAADRSERRRATGKGQVARQARLSQKEERKLIKGNYWFSMSRTPRIEQEVSWVQLLPGMLFTAFVILMVQQYRYARDMTPFYWASQKAEGEVDFFSHVKMQMIIVCAIFVLLIVLYRLATQSFALKWNILYIPMGIYTLFVLLSWVFSEYKFFAWIGFNDRFEGTFAILCYMFMLFYIINFVNSERAMKLIIYSVAAASVILGAIGLSQATGHDFFQTVVGQKLITPKVDVLPDNSGQINVWEQIDAKAAADETFLKFTFEKKEIYQTVYNTNYVSFYLTLLIPLFAMLFIWAKQIWKKAIWLVIFALAVYNLIGSASSSGLLGSAVIVVIAIVIFNKRILKWFIPLSILFVVTVGILGLTYDRWIEEINAAWGSAFGSSQSETIIEEEDSDKPDLTSVHQIDYLITKDNTLRLSMDGNELLLTVKGDEIVLNDGDGNAVSAYWDDGSQTLAIQDARFSDLYAQLAQEGAEEGEETENAETKYYLLLKVRDSDHQFPFLIDNEDSKLLFYSGTGKLVNLDKVPSFGFENHYDFGTGRGYIWSRTIPMIAKTLVIGHGADTFCIYFPHDDYAGKFNAGWGFHLVVDKPHNMYLGIAVNTGLISLLALFALFGIYFVQSLALYWPRRFDSFASYAGVGIFLGICGFLVAGFFNDSSVSIMPIFYGLLGTGIAANMIIKRQDKALGEPVQTPPRKSGFLGSFSAGKTSDGQ